MAHVLHESDDATQAEEFHLLGRHKYVTLTFRANNLAHKMAQIHLRATLFGAIMA